MRKKNLENHQECELGLRGIIVEVGRNNSIFVESWEKQIRAGEKPEPCELGGGRDGV